MVGAPGKEEDLPPSKGLAAEMSGMGVAVARVGVARVGAEVWDARVGGKFGLEVSEMIIGEVIEPDEV